eukprot:TRINITY_DN12011_c0_g2_i1.p1 TRINITY_DN12011_c0_g2~~TRINITY_DN12011_c0_g2_i1.p1  ORF type:complete len:243 (+),score=52.75 TRINITY_DN12011_c0_g2_i1:577-1305(+)
MLAKLYQLWTICCMCRKRQKKLEANERQDTVRFKKCSVASIWTGLGSYETDCITEYVGKIKKKLVISREDNKEKFEVLNYNEEDITPQFQKLDLWVKQKRLELKAYITTVEELEALIAKRVKISERKGAALQRIEMLRNKAGKEKESMVMENEIKKLEEDLMSLTGLLNITITYMTKIFLPVFKRRQLLLFYGVVQQFFQADSAVFSKQAEVWTSLLSDKILKHFCFKASEIFSLTCKTLIA